MTILLVEDDTRLTELMRAVLAGGGADVAAVDDVDVGLDLARGSLPEVVVTNAVVAGASGVQFVRALRALPGGSRIRVLVHTAFPDPLLRDDCLVLGVEHVLVRPFSMLDLAAMIQRPPAAAPVAAPPPVSAPAARPSNADPSSLGHLVRLWARRANGIVQVTDGEEAAWVMLAGGGPIDADGMAAIDAALRGGSIDFQPCDVEGEGRHAWLGDLLWRFAWEAASDADEAQLAPMLPMRNRLSEAIEELPLPPAVRTFTRYLTQGVPLSVLVQEHGLEPVATTRATQALWRMGLIGLQTPASPTRARAARMAAADDEKEPTARTTRDVVAIRRLRREVALLKDADPWVVLGVPKDASADLLSRAAARMEQRYEEVARDGNPVVKELGVELLARIRWAMGSLRHGMQRSVDPGSASPEEDAFRNGQRAMTMGDWASADKWFNAAREANMDSARNLAHLGWARLHNPDLPLQERVEEGMDLLLLAEQIDSEFADGQYFLAVGLHRQGDDDGALKRIRRALRAQPDHVAASALARKLRRPPNTTPTPR